MIAANRADVCCALQLVPTSSLYSSHFSSDSLDLRTVSSTKALTMSAGRSPRLLRRLPLPTCHLAAGSELSRRFMSSLRHEPSSWMEDSTSTMLTTIGWSCGSPGGVRRSCLLAVFWRGWSRLCLGGGKGANRKLLFWILRSPKQRRSQLCCCCCTPR